MDWNTKKTTIENLFKEQLLNFLEYLLSDILTDESNLLIAITWIKDNAVPEDLTLLFCGYILPNSEKIENRDEKFFLENKSIFSGLNGGTVDYFKSIWTSDNLSDENKSLIWKWFVKFNKICKKYNEVLDENPEWKSQKIAAGEEGTWSSSS